jgi:hypothetical protein
MHALRRLIVATGIAAFILTTGSTLVGQGGAEIFRWDPGLGRIVSFSGACLEIIGFGKHNFPHDRGVPALGVFFEKDLSVPIGLDPSPLPSQQGGAPLAGVGISFLECATPQILTLVLHDTKHSEGFPFPTSGPTGALRILLPAGPYSVFIQEQEIHQAGGGHFLTGMGLGPAPPDPVYDVVLDPATGTLIAASTN